MDSVNVMAKLSHGGGGVGSIKTHRRRIVSEPTDSLVFTCDENSMKLGSFSPTSLLIRNDLHGEKQQLQQVHNNLISSPSMVISNTDNDMDGAIQLVSGSSDLFCGKPLQIDLDPQCIGGTHNIIPQQQSHHIGMVKTLQKKDFITQGGSSCSTKGLLQPVSGEHLQKQHPCNECDRLFTKPERLRQHHAYKHTNSNNGSNGASNGNGMSPTNLGGTQLNDEQQIIAHTTTNSTTVQQQHECGQCGKAFCSKVQLGRHVKIHSGEKAFLCSQCEQSFHRKDHLKTHEKTHQTNNDNKAFFECDRAECGKTYNSYSSYMKHRKTHEIADASLGGGMNQTITLTSPSADAKYRHNSTTSIPQTVSVGTSIQLKDTADNAVITVTSSSSTTCSTSATTTPSRRSHREQGEKRFQCMQCSKKFPTSKDLKRHDVVHTGNREFQCSFCSHRFGRKDHRMRHEKKTHAIELSNQQQNLNGNSGVATSGSHVASTTSNCSLNQPSITQNNPPSKNINLTNLQSSLPANQAPASSPSSTSSPVSPPSIIPTSASTSSPTNTTFSLQPSNPCVSPNPLSHPYSPNHQFQLHDQLHTRINILALSPPPATTPCQILETTISSAQLGMANNLTTQNIGMIDATRLQANKRWRHVSSPSTLQQVQPPTSNIPILNPNIIPSSLRTNTALFSHIIVENSTNGISCGVNTRGRIILSKNDEPDDPIDINTLLAEQSIRNPQADTMMISPKQEPPEAELFEMCDTVSENSVLETVGTLSQHQRQTGEIMLSQIKEEKEEKIVVPLAQCYNMESQLLMTGQQHQDQLGTNRIQTPICNNDSSILLSPLQLGQTIIKSEDFLLKKEEVVEEEMDEMMDDQPLSTQLQQTVRLKSENDCNGEIDWILTEMMTDPNLVTASSNIGVPQGAVDSSLSPTIKPPEDTSPSLKSSPTGGSMSNYLSSSVPIGNTFFGASCTNGITSSAKNVITTQHLAVSQFSQPKVGSLDTRLLYDDHNSASGLDVTVLGQRSLNYSVTPKKLLGDLFTRTKNPVLPSIYTDNTLIVPEPKASKYQSPHQSLQMFESDFMDIDSFFLKGGSTSSTGDGKDIQESIFNI